MIGSYFYQTIRLKRFSLNSIGAATLKFDKSVACRFERSERIILGPRGDNVQSTYKIFLNPDEDVDLSD